MTTVNSIMIADSYGGKVKLWNVMYADGGNCFITQVAQEALLNTVPSKNDSRNTKNKPCDFRCLAICISYLWYPCNGYKSISPSEDVKQLGWESWVRPSFVHITIVKKTSSIFQVWAKKMAAPPIGQTLIKKLMAISGMFNVKVEKL